MQTTARTPDFNGNPIDNLFDPNDQQVIDGFQYGLCVVSSERAGAKHYELTNHLGNVLAVISDHKIAVDATSNNLADYYLPDVLSMSDYYPFGSPMPGRLENAGEYRFGFNGFEHDDEVKGKGNHISFADYGYDPRTGRRWNIDPMAKKYPSSSPYVAFGNNPILFVDKDGNDNYIYVVFLPSSNTAFSKEDQTKIIESMQKWYNTFAGENNIKVRVFDQTKEGKFDVGNMDKSDAVIAIGNFSELKDFAIQNNKPNLLRGFTGGADNPEKSENNRKPTGEIGIIDHTGLYHAQSRWKAASVKEVITGMAAHITGHNIGYNHPNEYGFGNEIDKDIKGGEVNIMWSAEGISDVVHSNPKYKSFSDILYSPNNHKLNFKRKFSASKPEDSYHENKKGKDANNHFPSGIVSPPK